MAGGARGVSRTDFVALGGESALALRLAFFFGRLEEPLEAVLATEALR